MRIGLYGVSRAGKNYLINELCKKRNIEYISGSNILMDISGLSISQFKNLSKEDKTYWRRRYIDYITENYTSDKDIIIDGHYAFINSDTKGYDIAFTDKDLGYYDVFFYLDTEPSAIYDRLCLKHSDGEVISTEDIRNWKEYEIESMKKICRAAGKEFIILNGTLDEHLEFMNKVIDGRVSRPSALVVDEFLEKNANLINNYENVVLVDCDKTVSTNDSTLSFFDGMGWCKSRLKEIFGGDRYTVFQAYLVNKLYNSLCHYEYKNICSLIAEDAVCMSNDLIDIVRREYPNSLVIGVTSGIFGVWEEVMNSYGFPDILFGARFRQDNDYVTEDTKYLLAKKLKENGISVVAIGDSMIDVPMIEVADFGYLVAYEKINKSVQEYISRTSQMSIKQLDCSKCFYSDIEIEEKGKELI